MGHGFSDGLINARSSVRGVMIVDPSHLALSSPVGRPQLCKADTAIE